MKKIKNVIDDGFMHVFDKYSQTNKKSFGDFAKRMIVWPEFIQIGIAN